LARLRKRRDIDKYAKGYLETRSHWETEYAKNVTETNGFGRRFITNKTGATMGAGDVIS